MEYVVGGVDEPDARARVSPAILSATDEDEYTSDGVDNQGEH